MRTYSESTAEHLEKAALLLSLLVPFAPSVAATGREPPGVPPGSPAACYPPLPRVRWQALPSFAQWAFEDRTGRIWLGTRARDPESEQEEKLLLKRVRKNVEAAFHAERPLLHGAEILYHDSSGRLWIKVDGKKFAHVLAYDGTRWWESPLQVPTGKWNYAVQYVYEDADGRVWLWGNGSICRLDSGRFIVTPRPKELQGVEMEFFSHPIFAGSADGLVMVTPWSSKGRTWCFRNGRFFPVDPPPGGRDNQAGWYARWPETKGRIRYSGFYTWRARVFLDHRKNPREDAVAALIAQLGDERFEVRQRATQELMKKHWRRRRLIQAALKRTADLEIRHRLHAILSAWDDPEFRKRAEFQNGPWITWGFLQGAAPRGKGLLAHITVRDAKRGSAAQKTGVYWMNPRGKRVRVPMGKGANNLRVRFDGRGLPLVSAWRLGTFRMKDGNFVRVTPEAWDPGIHELYAVDRKGRAYFKGWSEALYVYDPAAPERSAPRVRWQAWKDVHWLHVDSLGRAWAERYENGNSKGLYRFRNGRWELFRFREHSFAGALISEIKLLAQGASGAFLIRGSWAASKPSGELACGLGVYLVGTEAVLSAGNLQTFVTKHRGVVRRYFSRPERGNVEGQKIAVDGAGRIWFVQKTKKDFNDKSESLFVSTEQGIREAGIAMQKRFPRFAQIRRLLRLPGRPELLGLYGASWRLHSTEVPLWLGWRKDRPIFRPLYARKGPTQDIAPAALFVSSDGTLSMGWGGGLGAVVFQKGKMAVRPKERPPVLESPKQTFWHKDLVRETYGFWTLRALVVRAPGGEWRFPVGAPYPHTEPVADAQGRVWIGLPDRLVALRLEKNGLRSVCEIPWDQPARYVFRIQLDAKGRLWALDSDTHEAVCVELPK